MFDSVQNILLLGVKSEQNTDPSPSLSQKEHTKEK